VAQLSPAKAKVNGINQVCIVVKDAQLAAENYWNILGIGPWDIYAWEAPLVYDYKYYGKPAWARTKMALAQVGAVQLELMEHIDGVSIYQDFLMEHGEGLNHLNFLVDDVDATAEILAKEGFPSIQSGRWEPREEKGTYNYIDIKPLCTIWEAVYGRNIGAKPIRYPGTAQVSPAKVKVKGINQVAIVVKDVQKVAENYWNILGIGPWDIYAWEAPLVYDRTYHGKPSWAREKIALAQVGGVQLELCQPIDGDSVYQDFLMEHGEGLHHLNFLVDDVDETAGILIKEGFSSLKSERFREGGAVNYIDIKPLGAIWEVFHGETIGAEPTHHPEDSV
jgi:catechol 2,3-dioxygenase-like lactoylglutathione lyase family enzyme